MIDRARGRDGLAFVAVLSHNLQPPIPLRFVFDGGHFAVVFKARFVVAQQPWDAAADVGVGFESGEIKTGGTDSFLVSVVEDPLALAGM